MFGTQNNINQNQSVSTNMQQRENQREQEQTKEVRQGTVTRDFQFEKQKERIEQILQRPRSQEYMAALDMIDYLTSDDEAIIERLKENMGEEFVEELQEMTDDEIFEMITQAFHDEFAELETNLDDELQAVLSQCYIDGCDCHAIDQYGHILDHYPSNQQLPEDLERGRIVYRTHAGQCQCVEVYKTCCRVISRSGDVEVVKK
jgi:hypothetical protein